MFFTGADVDECWPLINEYHYSKSLPATVTHAFAARHSGGLFGDFGDAYACVLYSQPASRNFDDGTLELSRLVKKDGERLILSQFVAWSIRWLKKHTNTRLIISYSDMAQKHHGGIYQALNFLYLGRRGVGRHEGFIDENNKFIHCRAVNHRFGTSSMALIAKKRPNWTPKYSKYKNLYVMPLRKKYRKQFDTLSIPYEKPTRADWRPEPGYEKY